MSAATHSGSQEASKAVIVTVRSFYEAFKGQLGMEILAGAEGLDNVIGEKTLNRPALALTGYFKHFANERLQLFGAGEIAYLADLRDETQAVILEEILSKRVPAIIISRGLTPPGAMLRVAEEFKTPVILSNFKSKDFTAEATLHLEELFASRASLHATFVDIKGVGVLMRGGSGVGKSECALALIERGHSLVADDYVQVRLVGDREIIGTAKDLNRGFMECRGIGIINVAQIFGIRSVRREKRIDLVITFKLWQPGMEEERTGLDGEVYRILDRDVPHITLPVRPGRDMARLVEVAAMVQALRGMGYDPAKEFNDRLMAHLGGEKTV